DLGRALGRGGDVARQAEDALDLLRRERPAVRVALSLGAGTCAEQRAERAVEQAEAGVARVAAGEEEERVAVERDIVGLEAVLPDQAGQHPFERDVDLLLRRVTGDADLDEQ